MDIKELQIIQFLMEGKKKSPKIPERPWEHVVRDLPSESEDPEKEREYAYKKEQHLHAVLNHPNTTKEDVHAVLNHLPIKNNDAGTQGVARAVMNHPLSSQEAKDKASEIDTKTIGKSVKKDEEKPTVSNLTKKADELLKDELKKGNEPKDLEVDKDAPKADDEESEGTTKKTVAQRIADNIAKLKSKSEKVTDPETGKITWIAPKGKTSDDTSVNRVKRGGKETEDEAEKEKKRRESEEAEKRATDFSVNRETIEKLKGAAAEDYPNPKTKAKKEKELISTYKKGREFGNVQKELSPVYSKIKDLQDTIHIKDLNDKAKKILATPPSKREEPEDVKTTREAIAMLPKEDKKKSSDPFEKPKNTYGPMMAKIQKNIARLKAERGEETPSTEKKKKKSKNK